MSTCQTKVFEVLTTRGKATWHELLTITGASPRTLGLVLGKLLSEDLISGPIQEYPGWEDIAQYRLVVRNQRKVA